VWLWTGNCIVLRGVMATAIMVMYYYASVPDKTLTSVDTTI
jgi:hypothetical protein